MLIAGFALAAVLFVIAVARAANPRSTTRRYCTKHVVKVYVPGGPEHLTWVYGTHRTPGNACDGPCHRHVPWFW